MPDGRRLVPVNVVCVIAVAYVGGKEGKKGVISKSEAVDSEHGASKGGGSQLHLKSHHSK